MEMLRFPGKSTQLADELLCDLNHRPHVGGLSLGTLYNLGVAGDLEGASGVDLKRAGCFHQQNAKFVSAYC